MASENIVPPFSFTADKWGNCVVSDGKGDRLFFEYKDADINQGEFFTALCEIMNENSARLCHAANGEEVRDGE